VTPGTRVAPDQGGPGRSAAIVALAALASFTANVDLSIVNLALPVIGRAFETTQTELAWTVNAYVLPYAVSILAVGRLADRFGHRTLIVAGALLFAAGSVASAVAPGYGILLAGRVLQGLGGSALLTVGLAIISASFTGAERGRALGIYFAAGASAAVVGPIVGGLLTSVGGWPAIFWSQIPLAVAVAFVARRALPAPTGGRARALDLPGLAWAGVALLGVNAGLLQSPSWGATSPAVLLAWAIAVAALAAFIRRERRAAEPAVRLSVFRSRIYVASVLVGGAVWFGILSAGIQLAIYLQSVRGLDPTGAALVLTPWPLAAALVFPRASRIVERIGPERTMVGSLVVTIVAAGLMVLFDGGTPFPLVALVALLGGVPLALGVTASTVCALAEFPPHEAGVASGVFNSLRQVGSSLGVAVPAVAFDVALAGSADGGLLSGSTAAFASRAVVFVIILALVAVIMPRRHATAVVAPA